MVFKEVPFNFYFLNPGVVEGEEYWSPPDLPFKGKKAKKLLMDVAGFVELYKDSKDITFLKYNDEDFDKFFQIRSELIKRIKGESIQKEEDPSIRAQVVLLFYWELEEKAIEIDMLNKQVKNKERALFQEIGLDRDFVEKTETEFKPLEIKDIPWKVIFSYFLYFIQEKMEILIIDNFIFEYWLDLGIEFQKKGNLLKTKTAGIELIPDEQFKDMEWLFRDYEILFWE